MKVDLLYGKKGLVFNVPDWVKGSVIRKRPMKPLPDAGKAVTEALLNPVGSQALASLAAGKKTACILICDITRPVPNGTILPPVIECIEGAGISRKNILILVATGLHRPNEGSELREIIGSQEIFKTVRAENHFARDRDAHVSLGVTTGGIPIMID
ncbi:MAG: hypothetical protein COZ11_15355, partial [Deltaproteobacteria bacterium CG_4_10_14_3_um_filter_51_14]